MKRQPAWMQVTPRCYNTALSLMWGTNRGKLFELPQEQHHPNQKCHAATVCSWSFKFCRFSKLDEWLWFNNACILCISFVCACVCGGVFGSTKQNAHTDAETIAHTFFFSIQHSPIQMLLRINTWALIPSTIMVLQEYKREPQTTPSWPATGEQHAYIYSNKLHTNLGEGDKKKKKRRGWEGDTGIRTYSSFHTLGSIVKQERGGEHGVPYILHCPWSLLLIDNSC